MHTHTLATTEQIIADAKAGKMFILVDDESRENEGDIIIPACFATANVINFMITHARGLVCLAITQARADLLELPLQPKRHNARFDTAFTVSIEAREGVTTGISAADRACTIATAIADNASADNIATPGHIFPVIARDGGVLTRPGHTEAAVDIAQLAGVGNAGVICEIINEDGTMARLPELMRFAEHYDLHIGTIADLIAYRRSC